MIRPRHGCGHGGETNTANAMGPVPTPARHKGLVVGLEAGARVFSSSPRRSPENLPEKLGERFEDFEWRVEVTKIPPRTHRDSTGLRPGAARELMLSRDPNLAVCADGTARRAHGRPMTAHVSPSHGVGLDLGARLGAGGTRTGCEGVIDLVSGLVGGARRGRGRRPGGHPRPVQGRPLERLRSATTGE